NGRQLRVIGDVLSVGGIHWIPVESWLCGDLLRRSARHGHHKQITVGADRLDLIGYRRKANLFGIRREIDVVRATAFIGRYVVVGSGCQIAGSAAAVSRYNEQVAALAFRPVIPVAVEQVVRDVCFDFVLFFLFVAFFVAGVVLTVSVDA